MIWQNCNKKTHFISVLALVFTNYYTLLAVEDTKTFKSHPGYILILTLSQSLQSIETG